MMLTEAHWTAIAAAMDRIIPADDWPGAVEAGAGVYLAGQLDGDLRSLGPFYAAGADGLDAEALAQFRCPFHELAPADQDRVLAGIEAGTVTARWTVDPADFFSSLVAHTAEGYYADPGNGGNRDGVSWKMIGFGSPDEAPVS